jgi:hypothetical protein
MAVPYTFGSATTSIPLSQLDSNFATTITLGNTAVQLGNTITNLTGVSNVASATSLSLGSNGNTTAVTIDTSQQVLAGVTSNISGVGTAGAGRFVSKASQANSSANYLAYASSNDAVLCLGHDGTVAALTATYAASAGYTPMAFYTGGAERMRIDSSGNVLVGATSAVNSSKFLVAGINGTSPAFQGAAGSGSYLRFYNNAQTTGDLQIGQGKASGSDNVALIYNNSNAALVFGTNGTEAARIDSSGNLLVGLTAQRVTEKFNVTATSADSRTEVAVFENSSDSSNKNGIRVFIGVGGNNTSSYHFRGETRGINNWYLYGNGTTSYSSDIRLKKNVQTARGYLEDLNKLRVVKYQWKGENPDCQQVELGLIAQEVEEVFPNLIQEHEMEGVGNIKNIKQSVIPFMMLKAIQELKAINDTQAETINALTARIVALESK